MKWIHFLFNKINNKIGETNVSFYDNLEDYYQHYKPKEIINSLENYFGDLKKNNKLKAIVNWKNGFI